MGESITKMFEDISKNQLIAYFLIVWAVTFFFSAVSGFVWIIDGHYSIVHLIIEVLWNLSELGCAAILGILGLKMLENK
jgi:hypothetical protein